MFNTALVLHEAALFGGFSAACRDGRFVTVCFCEAVLEASLWDLLSSITITISISICHSTYEELLVLKIFHNHQRSLFMLNSGATRSVYSIHWDVMMFLWILYQVSVRWVSISHHRQNVAIIMYFM
jgi:hypothetical protein